MSELIKELVNNVVNMTGSVNEMKLLCKELKTEQN